MGPDDFPRPLRLAIGLGTSLAILIKYHVIHISLNRYSSLTHLAGYAALTLGILVIALITTSKSLKDLRRRPINEKRWKGGKGGIAAFRVRALDAEASSYLSKFIKERISKTSLEYAVLSVFSDGGSDSLLFIRGPRPEEVVIESEVIQALASAIGKFRVEKLEIDDAAHIEKLILSTRPRRSREPVIIVGSSDRREKPASGGAVFVGYTAYTPTPRPIYLLENDLEGHVAVFGSTGSGKSTTAATIACRVSAERLARVVVLDWTGEHAKHLRACGARVLDPLHDGVGFWLADDVSIDSALEVMSLALELTPPQEYLLLKVLEEGIPGGLAELATRIESLHEESKWDREVKRGLLRKIGLLASRYSSIFRRDRGGLEVATGQIVVVDLNRLEVSTARRAAALLLLAGEYERRRRGAQGQVLYIIEEAHNVLGRDELSFGSRLLAESRKYGMRLMVVTQSPALMPNSVILNTSVKIVHRLQSRSDKDTIAYSLGLDEDSIRRLDRLERGEALVYAPSIGEPVFVKIELPDPLSKHIDDTIVG